jgi:TonB family protein
MEALIVKNLLLRHQAALESNPVRQAQLIAEADQLRAQALEMQRSRRSSGASTQGQGSDARSASVARPAQPVSLVDGQAPIRVGGNMQPPLKIKNVPPLYPPEALAQQVTGVVIIEATIDSAGLVRDTRVLRSIQMLDEAAVDAVRQWEFEPTMMNGAPVPVVMTVTVNFTLQ